jgi:hypothetical protein|tara:strand:+ start:573 stop:815 length:243 start_codon:yes stop_codon:yes gene_type:complete
MDNELIRLLIDYMTQQESEILKLNKKLTGLEDLMVINNNLLGFLSQIVAPYQKQQDHNINTEIYSYLVKYSIENESWGKS